jgi:hypothetical protein
MTDLDRLMKLTPSDLSLREMETLAFTEAARLWEANDGNIDIHQLIAAIGKRLPEGFAMFPLDLIQRAKYYVEAVSRPH